MKTGNDFDNVVNSRINGQFEQLSTQLESFTRQDMYTFMLHLADIGYNFEYFMLFMRYYSKQDLNRLFKVQDKLFYRVEHRYSYWAIDEHKNPKGDGYTNCTRMIDVFKTKKQAQLICGVLNELADEINELKAKG